MTVPLVQVQRVFPIVRHIHIRKSVVVDVPDRHTHPVACITQTGCVGDIEEMTVRFLAKQPVLGPCRVTPHAAHLGLTAIDQVDVQIPVAVVVDECRSPNHDLRIEPGSRRARIVDEIQSQCILDFLEQGREIRSLLGIGAGPRMTALRQQDADRQGDRASPTKDMCENSAHHRRPRHGSVFPTNAVSPLGILATSPRIP